MNLALRSFAALALMVGFYALAIAIVAVLVGIPYAEWEYGHRVHPRLAFACLAGAAAIAWSILPRRDRFEDPGPRLDREAQPELFRVLEGVARETGQAMPRTAFLVPDVNAWVANRGGVMGFGSHRVMGLGLPLLEVLSVAELRAVLAHEFGHYHGGDTRLGPWIYKTRAAIGRTLESLGEGGVLHLPFRWYGNFFLRVTQAISRAQEFTADRLAATVTSARALIEGLKKVHAVAPAFPAFWQQEALPLLNAGFHAPLAAGFGRFLRAPRIEKAVGSALAHSLGEESGDPYDSHPPLPQRIAAVEALADAAPEGPDDDRSAVALLGDVDACEHALLDFMASQPVELQPLAWEEAVDRVYLPGWREQAEQLAEAVGGATLAEIPDLLDRRAAELVKHVAGKPDLHDAGRYAVDVLSVPIGAGITCALLESGWTAGADPGDDVTVRRGETTLEPFAVVGRILAEDAEEDARRWWAELVGAEGIGALRLAQAPGVHMGPKDPAS